MKAHLITIGDEILIGQVLNTNAAYIGSVLIDNNIEVSRTSVVGDDEQAILDEFKYAFHNNDLVICTGGLGPTHDDITLDCIAKFFETELVQSEEVLDDIRRFFLKRNKEVTKLNETQALVPKNARVMHNNLGTAPGTWIEKDGKIFVSMPGVPFEMKAMMQNYVMPWINEKFERPDKVIKMLTLQTTGIGESFLYEKLGNIDELLNGEKLAFLPSQFGTKLRITVNADNQEEASNKISEIEQKIRTRAGRYIFGKGDDLLEEVVSRLLKERGLTIAIAESCTGGNICNLLTNISGSSAYFERGVVTYSNGSKVEILKVNEDAIAEHGAVSREVALQMAEGVRSISGTDIGLSVTGILGPTGGNNNKPVGLVYIGYCDETVCTAKQFQFGEDRILNKQRATQAALDVLRRCLLGINLDD